MINCDPYSPHSQGVVERIHLTIRYALLSRFSEDEKSFDISKELPIVTNSYNNTIHRIIKHLPNEVFYSSDSNLFNKVYNNILDFYDKTQKYNIIYDKDEKALLVNNIMKSSKKIKKDILF